MKPIGKLLNQERFLKTLFDSIPCGVLIVDRDRRIQAVNNVMERTFGISSVEVIDKRGGEALNCIHASESPKGCGFADECQNCQVRNTALKALADEQIHRKKANLQLLTNGKNYRFSITCQRCSLVP